MLFRRSLTRLTSLFKASPVYLNGIKTETTNVNLENLGVKLDKLEKLQCTSTQKLTNINSKLESLQNRRQYSYWVMFFMIIVIYCAIADITHKLKQIKTDYDPVHVSSHDGSIS